MVVMLLMSEPHFQELREIGKGTREIRRNTKKLWIRLRKLQLCYLCNLRNTIHVFVLVRCSDFLLGILYFESILTLCCAVLK
jgi:hypothetical protein